tara:strand:- start:161 stop:841 length:681 start_codon:yes stop_codon:yes gene_type:complete
MIVSIHQPNYIPWLPFFNKIKRSDIFVILDDVKYTKNDWRNRNKIRSGNTSKFLTIPIRKIFTKEKIKNVQLPEDNLWKKKHLNSISYNYSKSSFYKSHISFFEEYYNSNIDTLSEFNNIFLKYCVKLFNLKTKIIQSSSLEIDSSIKSTDRLIEIITKVGGKKYYSGIGSKNYLDEKKMSESNIELIFQDFKFKNYVDSKTTFIPGLSVIDLINNVDVNNLNEFI